MTCDRPRPRPRPLSAVQRDEGRSSFHGYGIFKMLVTDWKYAGIEFVRQFIKSVIRFENIGLFI